MIIIIAAKELLITKYSYVPIYFKT